MSGIKLSAPVGLAPRTSKGDPVQNRGADVKLVRSMLRANGMPSKDSGNIDNELLKLIALMQKKAGVRPPDQVVDPGGLTYRKMLPAYQKELAELGTGTRVLIDYKGKKLCISKADFDKLQAAALKELKAYIDIFENSLLHNQKMLYHWAEVVKGGEGYLKSISMIVVITAGRLKLPDAGLAAKAGNALKACKAAHSAKDFKALERTIPACEKAVNAFTDDMLRFCQELGRSAKKVHFRLSLASGIGWMAVGAMATPVLIGAGMGAGGAAIVGSAGTAMLQTAVNELGKHASGQDRTMWESLQAMILDAIVGGLSGKLGTLKLPFVKKLSSALGPALAREMEGYVAREVAEKFCIRFINNTGKAAVTSAVAEFFKGCTDVIKKGGKAPTEKEVVDRLTTIIRNTVMAGIFGELGRFQTAWVHKRRPELIGKTIAPDILKTKFKKVELTENQRRALIAKVETGVTKKLADTTINAVVEKATGSETKSQLLKTAEKQFVKDADVRKAVEKAIEAELKRMKVPAG